MQADTSLVGQQEGEANKNNIRQGEYGLDFSVMPAEHYGKQNTMAIAGVRPANKSPKTGLYGVTSLNPPPKLDPSEIFGQISNCWHLT